MDRDALAREAKRLIDRIAETPRAAGSAGEARARKFCGDYLARSGFSVSEEEFSYSALPGRWATPLVGFFSLTWFVVLGAALDRTVPEQTVREAMTFLPLLGAFLWFTRRQMRRPRRMLRRAKNLIATRGGVPRIWFMAHLDSKSQGIPMLWRIGGIVVASAAMLTSIVASFIPRVYDLGNVFWVPLTVAGLAGSVCVVLSTVGDKSPGALDNASGVAAAMLSATEAAPGMPVGVLLTSAEELGLAGARAWVRDQVERHPTRVVKHAVNFDGVDDVGTLTCMSDRGNPLARDLRIAASRAGSYVNLRGVLPGIMVDANELNRSGWDAVTISKGNFSTLARIHTPRDEPGRLTGTGVAEAVGLVMNFLNREA